MALKLIQGEDKVLSFYLTTETGIPISLSGVTEIEIKLPLTAGGTLSKKLSTSGIAIVTAANGEISLTLSDTESATIKASKGINLEAIVDVGSLRKIVKLPASLDCLAPYY